MFLNVLTLIEIEKKLKLILLATFASELSKTILHCYTNNLWTLETLKKKSILLKMIILKKKNPKF